MWRHVIGELVAKYRLPTVHVLRAEVEAGGLMSYAPSGSRARSRCACGRITSLSDGAR